MDIEYKDQDMIKTFRDEKRIYNVKNCLLKVNQRRRAHFELLLVWKLKIGLS